MTLPTVDRVWRRERWELIGQGMRLTCFTWVEREEDEEPRKEEPPGGVQALPGERSH